MPRDDRAVAVPGDPTPPSVVSAGSTDGRVPRAVAIVAATTAPRAMAAACACIGSPSRLLDSTSVLVEREIVLPVPLEEAWTVLMDWSARPTGCSTPIA